MKPFDPIRRRLVLGLTALAASSRALATGTPDVFPATRWAPHPEVERFRDVVAALREAAADLDTTAMLVAIGGQVVFEHGDTAHVSYLASARKSVLAMLYGSHVAAGRIRLDATLASLGIDDLQGLSVLEKTATVEHLLTARSGIYHPASNPGDDTAHAPARGSVVPGAMHLYNNWDFNAAGAVFERCTGVGVHDALALDLAGPLGMEDFDRARQYYDGDLTRSRFPAYHMRLSTRDMARLGLLMLRGGSWAGTQILPAGWTRRITRLATPHDELIPERRRSLGQGQRWGYGCMWWVWDAASPEDVMAGAIDARGLFGQHITVIPKLDLVIAHKVDPWLGMTGRNRRRVRSSQYARILRAATSR